MVGPSRPDRDAPYYHDEVTTEMYDRTRTWAISTLLATVALLGCSDDGPVGTLSDCFNPVELGGSVVALLQPVDGIASPTVALQSAFPFLVNQGLTFDVAGDAVPSLAATAGVPVRRVIAGSVEIPAELLGQTLVYDANQRSWVIDSERTGAPADGVRIIWYTTDAVENFILPLTEQGYIDLTDEDDGTGSRIGILMVATPGDEVIADFTERLDSTTTATSVVTDFLATGFFVGSGETIDFEVDYAVSTDTLSGDSDLAIDVTLDGADGLYTLAIDGTETGSDGSISQNITAEITGVGTATVLNLDIAQNATGLQSGGGTLVCDGDVVVQITVEGNNFRYADPTGAALGGGASADVDYLVRALYLTGLDALLRLPLLFL